MATKRYSAPFIEKIIEWTKKLSRVSDIIEQWSAVQNKYIDMRKVFNHGDIAQQLPEETQRFSNIDRVWAFTVTKVFETKLVVRTCCDNELVKLLKKLKSELELLEKSLAQYLESKRSAFPRFFFVSQTELLNILRHGGSNPQAVHRQIGVCIHGIKGLTLDRQEKAKILAIIGDDTVALSKPMVATGSVENWLNKLVTCVQVMQQLYQRDHHHTLLSALAHMSKR